MYVNVIAAESDKAISTPMYDEVYADQSKDIKRHSKSRAPYVNDENKYVNVQNDKFYENVDKMPLYQPGDLYHSLRPLSNRMYTDLRQSNKPLPGVHH